MSTNPTAEERTCTIGRCKCGGIVFAGINGPEYAKDNACEVAKLVRAGFTIETAPVTTVREGKWCSKSKEHMRG